MPTVWINGEFRDDATANISIRDGGFLHGAGVFTTMRSDNGRVFAMDRHLRRLRESCLALLIPLPMSDEAMGRAAEELLKRDGLSEARLRLTVTTGITRQDPIHGVIVTPTVLLTAAPLEAYPDELYQGGMTVMLIDEQKLNPYDALAGHKTLNYLPRLLALRDANQRRANEGLWFNVHNYLQSGCVSNVFIVKDRQLCTPPTNNDLRDAELAAACPYSRASCLPGIMRSMVIEQAQAAGISVKIAAINVDELLAADEVFLTNSIMRVMPVCRIERKTIGEDRPGKTTAQLAAAVQRLVNERTVNEP